MKEQDKEKNYEDIINLPIMYPPSIFLCPCQTVQPSLHLLPH